MPETPRQLWLLLLLSIVMQVYFPSGVVPKALVGRGWKAVLGEPCKSPSLFPKASAAGLSTPPLAVVILVFIFVFCLFLHISSSVPELFLSNQPKGISLRCDSVLLCWLFVMRTHVKIFSVI